MAAEGIRFTDTHSLPTICTENGMESIPASLRHGRGDSLPDDAATDSFDMLPTMIGTKDPQKSFRPHRLTHSF